jgi:hypothetical protein
MFIVDELSSETSSTLRECSPEPLPPRRTNQGDVHPNPNTSLITPPTVQQDDLDALSPVAVFTSDDALQSCGASSEDGDTVPPDLPTSEIVRDWLLRSKTKLEGFSRAGAFLCALFVVVLDCLRNRVCLVQGKPSFGS